MRTLTLFLAALVAAPAIAQDEAARKALDDGIRWLREHQEDGVWTMHVLDERVPSPGFTALALAAVARALPPEERAEDPVVRKATEYLLGLQNEAGAVYHDAFKGYENYVTSSTLMALAIVDDPATAVARARMRDYILGLQRRDEGRNQGGFGYNKARGADLSNAQFSIEALRAAGVPEDHEAMVRARAYLSRVQNRSENEAPAGGPWKLEHQGYGEVTVEPGNDGSAPYEPGVSKAGLRRLPDGTYVARGYGSMTYALLKSYILAGIEADDPRVKAALEWLGRNYTWDVNPGFEEFVEENPARRDAPFFGLFYYYMTAAKALNLAGVDELETPEGARDWRSELAAVLVKRQLPDGSWRNERSERWEEGDPVLATAYAAITLQEILGD